MTTTGGLQSPPVASSWGIFDRTNSGNVLPRSLQRVGWIKILEEMMKTTFYACVAACAACVLSLAATAGPVMDEPDEDAGQSLNSAADVKSETGGPVTQIRGKLEGGYGFRSTNGDWVDMYRINIVDPFNFSIETFPMEGSDGLRDPMLFLFNEQGHAMLGMNNRDDSNLQAALFNDDGQGNPLFTAPGLYYIAISSAIVEPLVETANGFFAPFAMQDAENMFGPVYPRGEFAGIPLADWSNVTDDSNFGRYEMGLTGVGSVPAPGMLALLGIAGVARRRRRGS